eukprot:6973192-Prymnesium_polylepis.1
MPGRVATGASKDRTGTTAMLWAELRRAMREGGHNVVRVEYRTGAAVGAMRLCVRMLVVCPHRAGSVGTTQIERSVPAHSTESATAARETWSSPRWRNFEASQRGNRALRAGGLL